MELTHEDIQKLHKKVREWKKLKQGDSDYIERGGQEYEIINSENSVTEAIAVAPIVNNKTDYSKTIVLTAGTQNKVNPLKNSFEEIGITFVSLEGAADAAYGIPYSIQLDIDQEDKEYILLRDSNGNRIDVTNFNKLPKEAKLSSNNPIDNKKV